MCDTPKFPSQSLPVKSGSKTARKECKTVPKDVRDKVGMCQRKRPVSELPPHQSESVPSAPKSDPKIKGDESIRRQRRRRERRRRSFVFPSDFLEESEDVEMSHDSPKASDS